MKGKIFAAFVLVMLGVALLASGRRAQASIGPVLVFDEVFEALNTGEVDTAAASFAEDATAQNLVRKETYSGVSEIRKMLEGMQRNGRRFDIVGIKMDGDMITASVEVSDSGRVWGTETVEAIVKDGKLQSFTVTGFRLELWRLGQ